MKNFIPPEIPRNPNLILIGERPSTEELKQSRPFVGPAGQLLRAIIKNTGARPIIVNAVNTFAEHKPTTEEINEEREKILIPLLDKYSGIPVVSLGAFAAQSIFKGKHGEGSMAGEALWLYKRPVLFTYHPSYYFHTKPANDKRILDHIEVHIKAALQGEYKPKYITERIPKNVDTIVVDTENESVDYPWYGGSNVIVGIHPVGFISYILKKENISEADRAYLRNHVKRVIGHDLMYDLVNLAFIGITFPNATFHDTLIYDRYTHGGELQHDLKFLAKKRLHFPAYEVKARQWWQNGGKTSDMPANTLYPYNAGDLYATEGLYNLQLKELPLFDLDMDYQKYVLQMTMAGVYFSRRKLTMISNEVQREIAKLEKKARHIAGVEKDFNFRSYPQLRSLFKHLGISATDTKADTLEEIKNEHPVIPVLLDLKDQQNLWSKGIPNFIRHLDSDDLIHSKFGVTETSRLKSSDPNIQNLDPRMRTAVRSRFENGIIIYPDQSQIEYRLIADAANEFRLIRIFKEHGDIHVGMYKYLFGRNPKNEKERKEGKTNNYASVYGEGFKKFLTLTGLDEKQAKPLFYKAKAAYPAINRYREEVAKRLKTTKRLVNIFGRERVFEDAELRDEWAAEREGFNWLFQSAGHDVTAVWIMEIADRLPKGPIVVADQHDEGMIDTPKEFKKDVIEVINSINMNELIEERFNVHLKVPLIVEISFGKVWS